MFAWTVAIKRHEVSQYCKSLLKLMLGVNKICNFKFQKKDGMDISGNMLRPNSPEAFGVGLFLIQSWNMAQQYAVVS